MNHCTEHTHMPHPDSLISTSHTHTIRTHTLCVNHVHLYSWYLVEHLMLNDCKDSDSHLNIPPCCFTGTDCYPLCTVWQQRHHNKPKGKTEQFTTTGFHQQHHVLHIYLNISCLQCIFHAVECSSLNMKTLLICDILTDFLRPSETWQNQQDFMSLTKSVPGICVH